jgi:hypothetical protein
MSASDGGHHGHLKKAGRGIFRIFMAGHPQLFSRGSRFPLKFEQKRIAFVC